MNSNLNGFSGTHGVGKTTICAELAARGFIVNTVSLPRAAQAALGWDTLRRIEESEANMWALQDMVLVMLAKRDREIQASGHITFVDRTPVDFAGYVAVWASRLDWKIDKQRYKEYLDQCALACASYGRQFFVPIRDEIAFVPEPNRGDLESREQNQDAMLRFMDHCKIDFHLLRTLEVNDRANEVLTNLNIGK